MAGECLREPTDCDSLPQLVHKHSSSFMLSYAFHPTFHSGGRKGRRSKEKPSPAFPICAASIASIREILAVARRQLYIGIHLSELNSEGRKGGC